MGQHCRLLVASILECGSALRAEASFVGFHASRNTGSVGYFRGTKPKGVRLASLLLLGSDLERLDAWNGTYNESSDQNSASDSANCEAIGFHLEVSTWELVTCQATRAIVKEFRDLPRNLTAWLNLRSALGFPIELAPSLRDSPKVRAAWSGGPRLRRLASLAFAGL